MPCTAYRKLKFSRSIELPDSIPQPYQGCLGLCKLHPNCCMPPHNED